MLFWNPPSFRSEINLSSANFQISSLKYCEVHQISDSDYVGMQQILELDYSGVQNKFKASLTWELLIFDLNCLDIRVFDSNGFGV